jgi:hypothetical protein
LTMIMVTAEPIPTDIILCDLDSTLADTRHRHHLAPTPGTQHEYGAWLKFAMACYEDEVMEGTALLIRLLAERYPIYFVSGRSQEALTLSIAWLTDKAQVPFESVRLHRQEDPEDNAQFKVEYVHRLRAEGLNPILAIDDWPGVATALRAIGVPTICLNPMYEDGPMQVHANDNPEEDPQVV